MELSKYTKLYHLQRAAVMVDQTGEGEAIMEIEKSGDDINSKSVTNSKSITDKER